VILRINPVSSRIQDSSETGGDAEPVDESGIRSIPPDMQIKQLTSIVKVKDGTKVLIGGLVQKEKLNIDTKVPLLGDIPYLGRLFHSTTKKVSKKEFFVVVVPQIIKQNRIPTIEEEEIIQRTQGLQFDTTLADTTEEN
jgi:general secretion pathway protein D